MKRSNKNTPPPPDPSPTLISSELAGPYDFGMAAFRRGDYPKAVTWFHKAAEQGHAEAQYGLGMMYAEGQGVPQDDEEAAVWLVKAADHGDAKVQYTLGMMYMRGEGVKQSYSKAVPWLRKACEQGHPLD